MWFSKLYKSGKWKKWECSVFISIGLLDCAFGNHLRIFNEIETTDANLSTSLNACKAENKSLVTAHDKDDLIFLYKLYCPGGEVGWLGLHKRQNNVTTWSNGKSLTFNRSQVTTADDNQICEAMGNGTWEGFSCSDRKPFMCYKGKSSQQYLLLAASFFSFSKWMLFLRGHVIVWNRNAVIFKVTVFFFFVFLGKCPTLVFGSNVPWNCSVQQSYQNCVRCHPKWGQIKYSHCTKWKI